MSQFPVKENDIGSIAEAVNYLLSGPGNLGQDFAGFSSNTAGWLTGNFRLPFTQPAEAPLYVAPIALEKSEQLDGRTFVFTFATEQSAPPFQLGNGIEVYGVTDDWYNDSYNTIGVVECTTTSCTVRTAGIYEVFGPSGGGYIFLRTGNGLLSTDANARVTVKSGTERVFISAQLTNFITYIVPFSKTDNLTYTVSLNRYFGEPTNDPLNPDFLFEFDETVASRIYTFDNLTNSATLPLQETVFTSVFDSPAPGYYWYILEVQFQWTNNEGEVNTSKFGFRSLSAQVVKQ